MSNHLVKILTTGNIINLSKKINMEIPKKYLDLIGTTKKFRGSIFSRKNVIQETDFEILDIRFGSGTIMNVSEMMETGDSSYEHPTFELLLKNSSMKRSQWSRGFPIREINLKETK